MARPEYQSNVNISTESTAMTTETIFSKITVSTAAIELKVGASRLAGRTGICIKADDTNSGSVFIGVNSNPTTSNAGFKLSAGEAVELALDANSSVPVNAIADTASQGVSIFEIK